MKKSHLTETKFSELNLDTRVVAGLDAMGFEYCTSIQEQSLPILLKGTDIAGQAQTGDGKSIAFLAATFHHLLQKPDPKHNQPRALIMAPTRELAVQVQGDIQKYGQNMRGLNVACVYGGASIDTQIRQLKRGCCYCISSKNDSSFLTCSYRYLTGFQ